MLATLLILSVLAAPPEGEQLELLKTFRSEFVELTPGEGKFPKTFYRGDASSGEINPASPRILNVAPFAIAKYEMPQNLYASVMGSNPSRWKGERNSVEVVSYADAVEFCQRATRLMRAAELIDANQAIRLPTEVEWEYACKAGTTTRYSFGNGIDKIDDYAWYTGNAAGNDPPVGALKPNAWDLYDMHGYLWEWTSSPWQEDAKGADPVKGMRVIRGGSWRDAADKLASHYRAGAKEATENDALGFRCVLDEADVPTEFKPTAQTEIVPASAKLEVLWQDGDFTEGPAWAPKGYLLFSDIGTKIYKYDPASGDVSVFRAESGKSNGLIFDAEGNLYACEGANNGNRRISVTDAGGKVRTLADSYDGKRFNSPNDLVLDADGNLYFTDPRYQGDEPRELDFEGVFRVTPEGKVTLATREVSKPNGIVLSADGKSVYVADNDNAEGGPRHLLKFAVSADGKFTNKQILFDFGEGRGIDGMVLGDDGNIYATAGRDELAGIYVFGPDGEQRALIKLPGDPTNCTFGEGKWKDTLFITANGPPGDARRYALYKIDLASP